MSEIQSGSPFDAIRRTDSAGEHWSARDLMPLLGYEQWRRFEETIERARAAADNAGHNPDQAFCRLRQEDTGGRPREDYRLSRYGAYLVAMNGDPRKPEIAAAQMYFAIKTRQAETAPMFQLPQTMGEALRLAADQFDRAEAERAARVAAEQRAAALEPSAAAWDHLGRDDGDWSVRDAAKILDRDPGIKTGQGRLFTTLAERGWIFRDRSDNHWRPYQAAVNTGRLLVLPQSHLHPRTGDVVLDPPQVRITPRGLAELHRRLGGTAPLAVEQQLVLAP